ncbi:penicillin-binding protein activator [candidate division KSB1 bacterium]|nr:penicillin-binding protein activator [candidate division KSB1 bacterium]
MNRWHGRLCGIIIALQLGFSPGLTRAGEYSTSQVEDRFNQALDFYLQEDYKGAEKAFKKLIKLSLPEPWGSACYFMLGKAYYRQGRYRNTLSVLKKLERLFPGSDYYDDAQYLRAGVSYQEGDYLRAATDYLQVIEITPDPRLEARAKAVVRKLIEESLSPGELKELAGRAGEKSGSFLTEYISYRDAIRIGVVLPLSGELEDVGESLLYGIEFAAGAFNQHSETKVKVIPADGQGEVLQTVLAVQGLVDNGVVALIGPITGETTAAAAGMACAYGVPLLAPLAAASELATIGDWVVQLNPNRHTRAAAIAEYALNNLGLSTFAILAPMDDYGKEMSGVFRQTISQGGDTVLVWEWYYQGAMNFSKQFKKLRGAGFRKAFWDFLRTDSTFFDSLWIDSMYVSSPIQDTLLKAPWVDSLWVAFQDSARLKAQLKGTQIDSIEIPLTVYGGIYLPVRTEDIQYVGRQFAYFNFQTQVLGDKSWGDREALEEHGNYVDGIIFTTDYYLNEEDSTYVHFRNRFRVARGKTPGKMEIIGYDAMNFLLTAIQEGCCSREDVRKWFSQAHQYQGIGRRVVLEDGGRTNKAVGILRFKDGKIYRLE